MGKSKYYFKSNFWLNLKFTTKCIHFSVYFFSLNYPKCFETNKFFKTICANCLEFANLQDLKSYTRTQTGP